MSEPAKATKSDPGSFIVLNGQTLRVRKNETDFTVMAPQSKIQHELSAQLDALAPLSPDMTRARAKDSAERDRLMGEVRRESAAHHVYRVEETGEEIVINDEIILKLRREGAGELEAVMREYSLEYVRRMGDAHVLRLTSASAENPVKTANRIGERDEVESCSPQVMLDLQFHQAQASLLAEQWYLSADFVEHPDVAVDAGIRAPEAWQITRGDPDVVVAVIDDGFDLDHPAFANVRLHPAAYDFAGSDTDVRPGPKNYHGTPVASIAIGTHGPTMHGIAPGCTFLPIRIGFGPTASQVDILDVFRLASKHADVVNCSFGTSPASFERMSPEFRKELTKLCETGGRRGKGLIMVFSAANDDAPTFLAAQDNKNGVLFVGREPFGGAKIEEIPAGKAVYSGYPMTRGVVVVAAASSLKRKAGYSCWGPHVTIAAPSNNMHYITEFIADGADVRRDAFVATYRGLGQVAASNRPGLGNAFRPIGVVDDPATPHLREEQYTRLFGGTSGAAPVVAGVVALMLSVNPDLTAEQVRRILMATADKNVDAVTDLNPDPNLQGLSGAFVNGASLFFGAGKVDAFRAVSRAKALRTEPLTPHGVEAEAVASASPSAVNGGRAGGLSASFVDGVPATMGGFAPGFDPRTLAAILRAGGSVSIRGDLPDHMALSLAEAAAQAGSTLTIKNPAYSTNNLVRIAQTGAGRVIFDFTETA